MSVLNKLADFWLPKTPEERKAFLEADNTSDVVRARIAEVEAYCREHAYAVFRDSTLRPRPFALHSLGDEGDRVAQASLVPELPLVCGSPSIALGHRYASTQAREETRARATTHMDAVTARLSDFLRSENVLPGDDARRDAVAALMVTVLVEAALAALQRTGNSDQIEAKESELHKEQTPQNRPYVLSLGRKGDAASTEESGSGTSSGGERGRGTPSPAGPTKPIAAHLNESVGLLGMWTLLGHASSGKRQRDGQPIGDSADHTHLWSHMRMLATASLFPNADDAQTGAAAAAESAGKKKTPQFPAVEITAKDMNAALLKALALPQFRALHPAARAARDDQQ